VADNLTVNEVRALTKWRHRSPDGGSALEITEVLQVETIECPDKAAGAGSSNPSQIFLAREWPGQKKRLREAEGDFMCWYEAAVVSLELEEVFSENEQLGFGEMAKWIAEELRSQGYFQSLYLPALEMLRHMDRVGRSEDNSLEREYGDLLIQPNHPPRRVVGRN